jgi:peptidoglycan glycosyltransferase
MNRPLRRIALALMVLFALLLANLNYLQAVEARDLNGKPGNSRILLAEYDRQRGGIIAGGRPIAVSVPTKDELKYLRRYSQGELYAHVTGFYSYVFGATGIERAQNSILAGTDDRLFVRRVIDTVSGKDVQGGTVALTIDPSAQAAAAQGLRKLKARGSVVAIEPSTGRILAMVSSPSYDPNLLSSHDGDRIKAAWKRLEGDPTKPLLSRAVAQTYPPGSTFKLVTAAAALSSGQFTPDGKVPGPARLPLPDTKISLPNYDARPCDPGGSPTTTLTNALRRSCNTTFAQVGLALGDDALREQARKFGFGTELDVPLDVAASVFPEDPNRPQTAQSSIGQFDVRATPLQMAMVAAGIANGGVVMKPHLVDDILAQDLRSIDRTRPDELDTAVTPQVAQQLTSMMVEVVESGTGKNARIDNVRVAGKTGTAQQGNDRPPHAWFTSFAPAENAQVAVAVVIEDGGGRAEVSGNELAAPIAKAVMQAVLAP